MALIDSRIADALFAALDVAEITDLVTGIHYETGSGDLPYIVIDNPVPGRPTRTFGDTLIAEESFWDTKVYSDEDSVEDKSPQAFNDEVLIIIESVIGGSLSIPPGVTWRVVRDMDIKLPIGQPESDKPVYGKASRFRIWATP